MNEKPEAIQFADDRPNSWNVDDLYQWATDAEELIRSMQARITEMEKDAARYKSWESVMSEVDRRAEKEWCLADKCDFTVTVTYEQYLAIDTAMQKD